jgi:MFS family permease
MLNMTGTTADFSQNELGKNQTGQERNAMKSVFEMQATQRARATPHTRLVFAVIIMAAFLDVVDFSIVQVALPTIRAQFSVSLADSQWIIGAYGLTMAGFLMLSGRAGDIYGQKKLFIIGIALFSFASLSGGLAPSLLVLIVARALQGIGAAMSTVTGFSIFVTLFPEGGQRNKALGILVAILSAGFAAGSIAGGLLTALFGWRSVMFVNVPIGAVAVVLSQKYLSNDGGRLANGRLDLPGALTVTSGLILLVYTLTNAASIGFSSIQTVLPLAISALLLASFIAIESKSKAPLMPLGFLRRGAVLNANVLALILTAITGGLSFIMTIYLQQILGYSALSTALVLLPAAIIFFVVGGFGSYQLLNRLGLKLVLVSSTILVTIGCALLTQIPASGNYSSILPGMLLWALGASIGFPALSIAALAGTRPGEEGLATGLISTSQRVGFPLGLAALVTIASTLDPQPTGVASRLDSAVAIVGGFHYAFFTSAILAIVGIIIALRIKSPSPPQTPPSGEFKESGYDTKTTVV